MSEFTQQTGAYRALPAGGQQSNFYQSLPANYERTVYQPGLPVQPARQRNTTTLYPLIAIIGAVLGLALLVATGLFLLSQRGPGVGCSMTGQVAGLTGTATTLNCVKDDKGVIVDPLPEPTATPTPRVTSQESAPPKPLNARKLDLNVEEVLRKNGYSGPIDKDLKFAAYASSTDFDVLVAYYEKTMAEKGWVMLPQSIEQSGNGVNMTVKYFVKGDQVFELAIVGPLKPQMIKDFEAEYPTTKGRFRTGDSLVMGFQTTRKASL